MKITSIFLPTMLGPYTLVCDFKYLKFGTRRACAAHFSISNYQTNVLPIKTAMRQGTYAHKLHVKAPMASVLLGTTLVACSTPYCTCPILAVGKTQQIIQPKLRRRSRCTSHRCQCGGALVHKFALPFCSPCQWQATC